MYKNRLYFLVPFFFVFILFPGTGMVVSQDKKKNLKADASVVRNRLRSHLKQTMDQYDLSQREKKISRLILNSDVPGRNVKKKVLRFLRDRYARGTKSNKDRNIKSMYREYKISSASGTHQSFLGLMYLVFREDPGPLYEYMHLTNVPMSTDFVKSQLTVAGKWDDNRWKAVWYDEDLLDLHLARIVHSDHLYYLRSISLTDKEIPLGFNTIDELKRLKKWYGEQKKFQDFVFQHPLKSFSYLQWKAEQLDENTSKKKVVEMIVDYGRHFIDDRERREIFFRRITGRFSESLSDRVLNHLNKEDVGQTPEREE